MQVFRFAQQDFIILDETLRILYGCHQNVVRWVVLGLQDDGRVVGRQTGLKFEITGRSLPSGDENMEGKK